MHTARGVDQILGADSMDGPRLRLFSVVLGRYFEGCDHRGPLGPSRRSLRDLRTTVTLGISRKGVLKQRLPR
jgi:hypothetical protein